jgi:hypothetical protein
MNHLVNYAAMSEDMEFIAELLEILSRGQDVLLRGEEDQQHCARLASGIRSVTALGRPT